MQSSATLDAWAPLGEALITSPEAPPDVFHIDDTTGLPTRFYRMMITPAP
jgi:hypothetical protein